MQSIKLTFSNGFDYRDVVVDEQILKAYQDEFVREFAKKTEWYSVGQMSGDILYEGRTYGEIGEFAKNLSTAKDLEENILALNPHLGEVKEAANFGIQPNHFRVTRYTWISLDDYMFDHCGEQLYEAIRQEVGFVGKKETYQFKTYERDGKEVVYFSFYQACYGDGDTYAVPIGVAYELNLGDCEGREMSRFDGIWNRLEPYKVSLGVTYDEQGCIEEVPFSIIEAFNFD